MTPDAPTDVPAASSELRWHGRIGVALFFAALLAFGAVTEMRSAFLRHRHTDAGVYFRAAWAVRAGSSLYQATDANGWHYHYPPLLAILLTPLADPPPGAASGWAPVVPYPVSVAIWYLIGVAMLLLAADRLGGALGVVLAPKGPGPPRYGAVWWRLRLLPILVLLGPIGASLGRGQANIPVMAAIAFALVAFIEERRFRGGLWLAFAASLKIFPVFLLLWPLARRDWRGLAGAAVGFVVFLAVIPAAVMGPQRAIDAYREMAEQRLAPYAAGALDPALATEMLNDETRGDVLSFKSVLFRAANPASATRPRAIPRLYDFLHLLAASVLAAATLLAARPPREAPDRLRTALGFGALLPIAVMAFPAAQSHYLCVLLPLAAALVVFGWQRYGDRRRITPITLMLFGYMAVTLAAELPEARKILDLGYEAYASLLLWGAAIWALRSRPR